MAIVGAVVVAVRNCRIFLDCQGFGWCWSPTASQDTLARLKDLPDQPRDIRSRRPGQAFEEAQEKGETPFQDQPGLEG